MLKGERPRIFGDGGQTRDFIFIDDVVEGFLLAASVEGVRGETTNIASGRSLSILELLETLRQVLGMEVEPEFVAERPGDVRHSLADISRAKRKLGFAPRVDHAEGLRRTVEHFKSVR
jgi:nucleoside-diphosphate-sugar epimerase